MVIDIAVDPPDRLDTAARMLRDIDDDLEREIVKRLDRVAAKLEADVKAEAGRRLPREGGLGARVAAGARLSTRRRGGRTPGVTVQVEGMAQLAGMDAGTVTHPVYGNRDVWVTQKITGGWFSEPMAAGENEAEAAIEDALDDHAADVARRLDSGI